eukprot:snap_masked-scaffold_39-processed-gene-0.17-mRNA-1 protein AED:1.00 eAED:1.00 QI:0/-1/0/0/-1/1/1/0/389
MYGSRRKIAQIGKHKPIVTSHRGFDQIREDLEKSSFNIATVGEKGHKRTQNKRTSDSQELDNQSMGRKETQSSVSVSALDNRFGRQVSARLKSVREAVGAAVKTIGSPARRASKLRLGRFPSISNLGNLKPRTNLARKRSTVNATATSGAKTEQKENNVSSQPQSTQMQIFYEVDVNKLNRGKALEHKPRIISYDFPPNPTGSNQRNEPAPPPKVNVSFFRKLNPRDIGYDTVIDWLQKHAEEDGVPLDKMMSETKTAASSKQEKSFFDEEDDFDGFSFLKSKKSEEFDLEDKQLKLYKYESLRLDEFKHMQILNFKAIEIVSDMRSNGVHPDSLYGKNCLKKGYAELTKENRNWVKKYSKGMEDFYYYNTKTKEFYKIEQVLSDPIDY